MNDYEKLEKRISELEQQLKNIIEVISFGKDNRCNILDCDEIKEEERKYCFNHLKCEVSYCNELKLDEDVRDKYCGYHHSLKN